MVKNDIKKSSSLIDIPPLNYGIANEDYLEISMKKQQKIILILIPLVISGYTHLWNPLGFPSIHIDEAHYMRRTMMVINGMGPQESATSGYPRTFDHPYFGQIFLAGVLEMIGYPNSLSPTPDTKSIEDLHLFPRIIIGVLAILDTLLLFFITERRYNITIALIASLLFAVMPMTWIFRRVYLDTILMPFLLSSILLPLYIRVQSKNDVSPTLGSNQKISKNTLILLSGIFLGLSIYTKIPAFTMIPLVGTLIYLYSGRNLRSVGIWFIPVILIPLLWPLYSIYVGQFDLWTYWVQWQTDRNKPLFLPISLMNFFQIDPAIFIIGIAGVAFAALRRDLFPLLWISPFLVFSFFVGWTQYFHLLPIFVAFCLSSAIFIDYLQRTIAKHANKILSYSIALFVIAFGLASTTMLITLDVNSSHFDIYAAIAQQIPESPDESNANITVIGSHWWLWDSYWITQYVLDRPHELIDPHFDPKFKKQIQTDKVLLIVDPNFLESISRRLNSDNLREMRTLNNESKEVSTFIDNVTSHTNQNYPYNTLPIMIWNENHPIGKVSIKRNY